MRAPGDAMAACARRCIGSPYRLHGRAPDTGFDCVGLVLACLAAAGRRIDLAACYGLRNADVTALLDLADSTMPGPAGGPVAAGDVLLAMPGPAQHHLLVALDSASFVHAHASLRRVVETPFPSPWPILRHWRLT